MLNMSELKSGLKSHLKSNMTLEGYSEADYSQASSVGKYQVMLNPESIKIDREVKYSEEQVPNTSDSSYKYDSTPGATLSFDLVIDCTGVVDLERLDMSKEMASLNKIIYFYNGKIHRPNYVKVVWGKLQFQGYLTNYNTTFTLFKPNGNPIRAEVSLTFKSYMTAKAVAKKDEKNSPDLTHLVEVTEGMTLPLICQKVWGNPHYYIQVARHNNLNKFRNLQPGTTLVFPPLVEEGG